MRYWSGRSLLWAIRGIAGTFGWLCVGGVVILLVKAGPEAYQDVRANGLPFFRQPAPPAPPPANPFEAQKPRLESNAAVDIMVYGGACLLGAFAALVVLAACDVATAILRTAMRADDIHALLSAPKPTPPATPLPPPA